MLYQAEYTQFILYKAKSILLYANNFVTYRLYAKNPQFVTHFTPCGPVRPLFGGISTGKFNSLIRVLQLAAGGFTMLSYKH